MKPDAGLPVESARVTDPEPRDEAGTDALRAHRARYTYRSAMRRQTRRYRSTSKRGLQSTGG